MKHLEKNVEGMTRVLLPPISLDDTYAETGEFSAVRSFKGKGKMVVGPHTYSNPGYAPGLVNFESGYDEPQIFLPTAYPYLDIHPDPDDASNGSLTDVQKQASMKRKVPPPAQQPLDYFEPDENSVSTSFDGGRADLALKRKVPPPPSSANGSGTGASYTSVKKKLPTPPPAAASSGMAGRAGDLSMKRKAPAVPPPMEDDEELDGELPGTVPEANTYDMPRSLRLDDSDYANVGALPVGYRA